MGMREFASRVKENNGNRDLAQKDMLWYLVGKVDTIEDKLTTQVTFCKTHLKETKERKVTGFQILTWIIAITAIVVAFIK